MRALLVAVLLAACVSDRAPGRREAALEHEQIAPSETDDGLECDDEGAIGCPEWGEAAPDGEHRFVWSLARRTSGRLFVLMPGGSGNAGDIQDRIADTAALRGYHVLVLTYPARGPNGCRDDLACYADRINENLTGEDCGVACDDDDANMELHPQDSAIPRLVSALRWAAHEFPDDGWDRYLDGDEVVWSLVSAGGQSNGSTHSSYLGLLHPEIGRVALLAGPNDGFGERESEWTPAGYVTLHAGITDDHYFGLTHDRNHGETPDADGLSPGYQVILNYLAFGMAEPANPPPFIIEDPDENATYDFHGAHMIVSTDLETQDGEAHNSVLRDRYCELEDEDDPSHCTDETDRVIGYEDAWRCILGTGDEDVGSSPTADAGADQTVECQGDGGASVVLDGSGSFDQDCDVITHAWSGPFGDTTGRSPTVVVPLGTSTVTLEVSDPWAQASTDTTEVTVADTTPPSVQVTLTPSSLWPPNHRMVRIDATVAVTDACGDAPVALVLTSVTSDQPDDGVGDGHTTDDVQEADIGTSDLSFLVRRERAGGGANGRTYTATYTATDASGNATVATATIQVPHDR